MHRTSNKKRESYCIAFTVRYPISSSWCSYKIYRRLIWSDLYGISQTNALLNILFLFIPRYEKSSVLRFSILFTIFELNILRLNPNLCLFTITNVGVLSIAPTNKKLIKAKCGTCVLFSHFYSIVSLDNLKWFAHRLYMQLILNSIAAHFRWKFKRAMPKYTKQQFLCSDLMST